jgi:RNA polymerase sigma factor (sigma-70 family)
MQPPSSDRAMLANLLDEDNNSFDVFYRTYFPVVDSYVRKNRGQVEDAEDVFQETILVLLHNIRRPGFVLTSSLKTYVYAIAKNLWLKRLRDNKLMLATELLDGQPASDIIEIERDSEISDEQKVLGWLERITENCQRILRALFFHQEPMENLMVKMGWKNKHTAANQKYKCLEQVKKKMKADHNFVS